MAKEPGRRRQGLIGGALLAGALFLGGTLRMTAADAPQGLNAFWVEWGYYGLGVEIHETGRYRPYPAFAQSAYRMPLYPALIAGLRAVAPGPRAVRVAQAYLDTAVIGGVYLMAAPLAGPAAAGAAAALYAFSPAALGQIPELTLDAFFTLFIVLTALAAAAWARRPESLLGAAGAGLAVGLGLQCRSTLFLFPVLLAAWTARASGRRGLVATAVFLSLAWGLSLPWVGRNARVFDRFIPFENEAALMGVWAASAGRLTPPDDPELIVEGGAREILEAAHGGADAGREAGLWRMSIENLKGRPAGYLKDCFLRMGLLWREQLLWIALMLGLCASAGSLKRAAAPLLLFLYFNIHVLMGVFPRYARPVLPVAIALGAAGAAAALRRALGEAPEPEGSERSRAAWAWIGAASTGGAALYLFASSAMLAEPRPAPVPPEYARDPGRYEIVKKLNDDGMSAALDGSLYAAEDLLSLGLEFEPHYGEARINRAQVRMMSGRFARAAEDFARASLRLERVPPGDAAARTRRISQF